MSTKQKLSFIVIVIMISVYFEFPNISRTTSPSLIKDEAADTTTAFNILDPSEIHPKTVKEEKEENCSR